MKYTEDQLTEWFDADTKKPTEIGVYEVRESEDDSRWYSFWDGVRFGRFVCEVSDSDAKRRDAACVVQSWRGLSSNPSAPKKRAGNKRKTAYLLNVSRINHGIAPCVVAVFSSAKVANSQLKKELALMKKQDGATAWLTHLRFRTPEA